MKKMLIFLMLALFTVSIVAADSQPVECSTYVGDNGCGRLEGENLGLCGPEYYDGNNMMCFQDGRSCIPNGECLTCINDVNDCSTQAGPLGEARCMQAYDGRGRQCVWNHNEEQCEFSRDICELETQSEIPEFSTTGIIAVIAIVIGLGVFVIKKK